FRQKRAKSNAGEAKKTQKRKGPTDPKNDSPAQDCHVEQTPPSASATKTNHKVYAHQTQLQLAVEKRNDIIAKLSSNLQEALASRDLVQMEAHSLAEQIRALQKQLQQVTAFFFNGSILAFVHVCLIHSNVFQIRIKVQSGAEVSSVSQHHHSLPSQDLKNNLVEEQTEDPTHESSGSCAVPEGFNLDGDSEIDTILHKLRFELEEEKKKNLQKQGREEERRENEATLQNLQTQLSQVQTQCLAVQQHKEEKAKLDREINELRQILQKEENVERRSSEDIPGSALYLQNMEDERQRQEEEMKKLKEEHRREIELVRQILEQREQELQQREEEVKVLKASANHPSHKNASIGSERTYVEEANVERGLDQDGINASIQGDILMERYLASAPLAYSQSSVVNESSELCSQLDLSHWQNISSQHSIKEAGDHQNFGSDDLDLSQMSQQQFEKTDLEKDLLNQQCLELQEELALKERDLEVLKEEVLQSAEELEEARSRWAQVTEELRHALWELEEEKQKRRDIEEEMETYKEDHLQETGTLIEREEEDGSKAMTVEEAESSTETFLLTFNFKMAKNIQILLFPLFFLKEHSDYLVSELEKTKTEYETTSALLNEKTIELETVLKELETTRVQVVNVQKEVEKLQKELLSNHESLQWAGKVKSELEAQISCLQQNIASLEEAKAQSVQQREEAKAKEQQMEEQIKKMEQVLEEELEQFENILKAKDAEVRFQVKEKENEVKALLEKQVLAVQEATEKLNSSHQQQIKLLTEKHQQEILELNAHLESELTKLQVSMEEEQKRQIGLIKQVTEREHERVISELTAKNKEELNQLRAEVSLELRESMEAAHQAELQQIQTLELEALRLSLTSLHTSHMEHSQENVKQDQTAAQTLHQLDVHHSKQSQEQEGRLLHQQKMGECRGLEQWEIRVAEERASLEEKQSKEMQVKLQDILFLHFGSHFSLTETTEALSEAKATLREVQAELQQAQARMEELQTSSKEQLHKLEEELKKVLKERGNASYSFENLVLSYKTELQEKEQHALRCEEKERQLKQEVVRLEEEKILLKQNSEEEMGQLWTQLESMRTSRRELGELKEQLLARSSHVDDIERLKVEFNEQKKEIKEQNEAELENLRRYFEKRLHASEESYKEEIALLQMRLVESALEESVVLTSEDWYEGCIDACLFCSLGYELSLEQTRSDITHHYQKELQEQKTMHALELEQLRAKVSDVHLKGFIHKHKHTQFYLKFMRPVGKSMFKYPFQAEKTALEQHLVQKYESSLAELKNKCKAKWEQERMAQLNNHSQEMDALNATHTAQHNSLNASHKSQLAAVVAELESKHRAELVALEAVFQETNQVQLEALEAELSRKHQEETDELEKRMLGNMDTLEATYLKEVQVSLRKRQIIVKDAEHKNILEQLAREQLSIREELRKELAQVHMEKFKAMAAELSFNELASQKEALDDEHCKALEALKKQVFDLEQQHNTALQDLTNTYAAEKEQLTQQFKLRLQELRGTSARELQAARRELEEESSRQRQHYLEEVELLKVRSEEKLQDKINQLMTEFEDQKEVELEELRRSFASDQQEKEQSYTNKMSQLTVQLQQLDAVVAQLRAEVGCLQGELQGKSAEMETMDTLLQRRERESQEGANLLKMLTDDLQAAKEEKFKLHHTNEKLAKVLVEMFRGIRATEEQIGQKINVRTKSSEQATQQRSSTENKDAQESGIICEVILILVCVSGISVADLTSDDLEMTQLLCESLLVSDSQINPVGEESVLNACCRLRQAVDMLLDLLNQANTQLEETRNVHLSLEEKFSKGKEDSVQLLEQHKLLLEQLDEEAKMKSQLQLELHKAEGLLEGYMAEKAVLEESLQQKENREERLVEELEDLKTQLKHQELVEENAILLRQKEHLSAGLGEREKALLAETERLTQDRLDLQRQAEKDHKTLTVRLRNVERELEEQETKVLETEMHNKTHTEDLNQRVQALEKQLKHNRQFIEEQAVEREHERDEFQQEIHRLEAQLRQPTNVDHRGSRLETLHAIIKDKTEDYDSLMAANQQAQRDLTERNEEIDKLAGRIRELEQALLNSTESVRTFQQLEQELHKAKQREQELTQDKLILEQQQLSSRLQISALQSKLDETRHCYHENAHDPTHELRDALDTAQQKLHNKEQEVRICLETVQKDLSIKEVELKHLTLQLELLTERNTVHVQELQEQISYLQEKASTLTINAEEEEECIQMEETEEETLPSALLHEKNQEIDHLSSEIQRLERELESARDDKISALEGEVEDLGSQVERLQSEVTRVRHDKQEEEERLHEVISTLQAELATLGPNLHEVSDSQDGDSFNPSPAPSPEPRCVIQEQEMGGKPSSLKHELNQTHSGSSHSLRSRLKSLQSQLETAAAEKESLERILLTQEEEYRGQGEEFGKRLKAERKKLDEIQDLLKQKEAELEEVKAQAEEERETRKLAEKERDSWKAQAEDVSPSQEKMVLQEAGHTLERQVQEIKSLETVKGELSAECELLRKREDQLREEIVKLESESASMKALIQDLTMKLQDQEARQEKDQKAVLTHADGTRAKADAALRQKEFEFDGLKKENQALRSELTAVKQGLSTSSDKAHKLHEEGQIKDRALFDLETDNRRLKTELQRLQKDLTVQEEEVAYQKRELQLLRQHCHEQNIFSHHQEYSQKSQSSLSSPEVLRRLECSEDRIPERFHTSVLDCHLSGLSGLNSSGLDPPKVKISPRVVMEPLQSRTITPDQSTQRTHSPGSLSISDNFSLVDSIDAEQVHELEGIDQTAPPSPLGSTSSMSAQEWASDGYGSNVSSELGARLRVELEQTERLDAQFVEYLRCRGMNPAVNTDSAAGSMSYTEDLLSPELQGLLKKVYHESCKILTLSQRRVSNESQLPHPPMSWQQEKRALQETVIALRELLCRMAQRHSQLYKSFSFSFCCRLTIEENDEALQREKSRVQELQCELEQEKALNLCKEKDKEEQREVSALFVKKLNALALFGEKAFAYKNVLFLRSRLCNQVKQEMVTCSNLRQELQIEQSRSALLEKRLEDTLKMLEDGRQHSLADSRDRKFISDLRSQLEQERRQGEGLADAAEKLRTELLESRRKWEEEDKTKREELQREQEAAAKLRVLIRTLKEQKREISWALEAEQERRRQQEKEVAELKEKLQLLKIKEKEMEEQWERERRKTRQEQMDRERRQERTKNKLLELQSLRQQDHQRVQELQQTLAHLEKDNKEMAAQRLIVETSGHISQKPQQISASSSNLLEKLLKENSELNERITSLSQEKSTYKHRLSTLEKQLRRTESELSAANTERENRPIGDPSSSRLQRYYERYLRAESFRKALVYQKRYLLLLLGGFQECEQATLCLIARMGARPSTPLSAPRRPIRRFRAAVQVIIALSRSRLMKFLTRKWQKAIRRPSLSATGHAGPKVDVLRQQQPISKSDLIQNRASNAVQRATVSALVPPSKSPFRLHNSSTMASVHLDGTSQDPEQSLTEYIHHLEKVQQRLVGAKQSEQC
uniref:Pericentrin n=1 Tax=Oryzias latipes TaxID=8090 RepID=A0A3P9JDG0_ORYLA